MLGWYISTQDYIQLEYSFKNLPVVLIKNNGNELVCIGCKGKAVSKLGVKIRKYFKYAKKE